MGIGNYKLLNNDELKALRESATECAVTGKPIDNPVVDHIHFGSEAEYQGLNPDWSGKIRGVIDNKSNLALGFIMAEAKRCKISPNEYLDKVKEYLNKTPTNMIYPAYPKEIKDYFKTLSTKDKHDYLEYEFGVSSIGRQMSDAALSKILDAEIKNKFKQY